MPTKKEGALDMIDEYLINPPDNIFPSRFGEWQERDSTDPMWKMSTLHKAAKLGLIELEIDKQYGGGCRWGFTTKALEEREKLLGGYKNV